MPLAVTIVVYLGRSFAALFVIPKSVIVFSVSIIPHTFKNTTLSQYAIGDSVNLENDIIGKYVDKLLNNKQISLPQSNISKEFLEENGF